MLGYHCILRWGIYGHNLCSSFGLGSHLSQGNGEHSQPLRGSRWFCKQCKGMWIPWKIKNDPHPELSFKGPFPKHTNSLCHWFWVMILSTHLAVLGASSWLCAQQSPFIGPWGTLCNDWIESGISCVQENFSLKPYATLLPYLPYSFSGTAHHWVMEDQN